MTKKKFYLRLSHITNRLIFLLSDDTSKPFRLGVGYTLSFFSIVVIAFSAYLFFSENKSEKKPSKQDLPEQITQWESESQKQCVAFIGSMGIEDSDVSLENHRIHVQLPELSYENSLMISDSIESACLYYRLEQACFGNCEGDSYLILSNEAN